MTFCQAQKNKYTNYNTNLPSSSFCKASQLQEMEMDKDVQNQDFTINEDDNAEIIIDFKEPDGVLYNTPKMINTNVHHHQQQHVPYMLIKDINNTNNTKRKNANKDNNAGNLNILNEDSQQHHTNTSSMKSPFPNNLNLTSLSQINAKIDKALEIYESSPCQQSSQ